MSRAHLAASVDGDRVVGRRALEVGPPVLGVVVAVAPSVGQDIEAIDPEVQVEHVGVAGAVGAGYVLRLRCLQRIWP